MALGPIIEYRLTPATHSFGDEKVITDEENKQVELSITDGLRIYHKSTIVLKPVNIKSFLDFLVRHTIIKSYVS